jgi:hypothetical protein
MPKSFLAPFLIAIIVCSSALAGTIHFARGATLVSVSICPPSASINVGGSVEFNSTVTGGQAPYRYQWFLNGTILMDATSASWTFKPPARGTYSVYLKVYASASSENESITNAGQSNTARVVVGKQSFTGSFGYPNPSSQASGSGTQYTVYGSRFMLNVEANVTSMSCLMDYQVDPYYLNQNCSYSFAIYRDNYGAVGSLVAQTAQGTMFYYDHDVPLWYTLDFPSVVHLAPAAYWLVTVQNDTQRVMISSSVLDNYVSVCSFISGMTFPASLPSTIYTPNYVFSMYASWEVNFSASLSEETNVLSVASNSTLSSLAYSSTTNELSFKVNGSSGTTGYAQVFISKTSLPDIAAVDVTLDGRDLNFTATSLGDSWVLYFVYSHSTHDVAINMQLNVVPEFPTPCLAGFLAMTFATLICLSYPIKNTMRAKTKCSTATRHVC